MIELPSYPHQVEAREAAAISSRKYPRFSPGLACTDVALLGWQSRANGAALGGSIASVRTPAKRSIRSAGDRGQFGHVGGCGLQKIRYRRFCGRSQKGTSFAYALRKHSSPCPGTEPGPRQLRLHRRQPDRMPEKILAALTLSSQRKRPAQRPRVAPATQLERQLCAIWSDVLGLSEVGVADDYYADLNRTSLLAVSVFERIERVLGARFSPRWSKPPPLHSSPHVSRIQRACSRFWTTLRRSGACALAWKIGNYACYQLHNK